MLYTLNEKNAKDKLTIFERFQIDGDLPKNKIKDVPAAQEAPRSGFFGGNTVSFVTASSTSSPLVMYTTDGTMLVNSGGWTMQQREAVKPSLYARAKAYLTKQKLALMIKLTETKVQYVFDMVLKNAEALKIFNDKMDAHVKLIENAKKAGQVAMVEKLNKEIELRKYENALIASGIIKRVTEKQLLDFSDKCQKGLCLDWIKNFTRPIPDEIVELKTKADEACLFDNYVVLYYDPENRSAEMTEAEKERAKDPILFGVMRASRNLYFIGDWKDEQCDLQLSDIVEKLQNKLDIP